MLDIWNVNWLHSVRRELEHTGLKNRKGIAYLFLVWINSKPCYFMPNRGCWRYRGGRGCLFKLPGQTNLYMFLSFIICRLYKLIFSEETLVTLQLRVSFFDLVCRFLALLPLAVCRIRNFPPRRKPALASLLTGRFETTMLVTVFIAKLWVAI
jgi:hypothetical protein